MLLSNQLLSRQRRNYGSTNLGALWWDQSLCNVLSCSRLPIFPILVLMQFFCFPFQCRVKEKQVRNEQLLHGTTAITLRCYPYLSTWGKCNIYVWIVVAVLLDSAMVNIGMYEYVIYSYVDFPKAQIIYSLHFKSVSRLTFDRNIYHLFY
jgi:hypothetical protein